MGSASKSCCSLETASIQPGASLIGSPLGEPRSRLTSQAAKSIDAIVNGVCGLYDRTR